MYPQNVKTLLNWQRIHESAKPDGFVNSVEYQAWNRQAVALMNEITRQITAKLEAV